MFSAEKKKTLADVARILARFGATLGSEGKIDLREDLAVTPPDPCETIVRFERTPLGDLIFKFELKWSGGEPEGAADSLDDLLTQANGKEDGHELGAGS